MNADSGLTIKDINVKDIRFPTSLQADGSDAMHTDPDYSCAYVTITTSEGHEGYGLTFTLGRGTEVVVTAVKTLSSIIMGMSIRDIYRDFAKVWRMLTSETQIRWIGPEKGVVHLATAAIINALWDLWGRLEGKPVWKLLVDMPPETLVSLIDFRYISDLITPAECIKFLEQQKKDVVNREKREKYIQTVGYPAYTTQVGWLGYPSDKVKELCDKYLKLGFTAFKVKVGQDLEDDKRRCGMVRNAIGSENILMVDANQRWDVEESISWMKELAVYKPYWIEEPTSPDDILGHATIAKELNPLGIGVATGEMCANRVMFKQFLQANALQYCQIDSARIGGVNEILSVYFMAKKMNVPVCPHAGGVGLCEMVQHLQMFDYVSLSGTKQHRVIEYVDQQHEHFEHPTVVKNAHYIAPTVPGYSTKFKPEAIAAFEFPNGTEWQRLFAEGIYSQP